MKEGDEAINEGAGRDPLTGEPGFHPIGTAAGGASGAMAGAAVGAIGGPVGAILGAAAGGLVGGLAGDALAELMNPSDVDDYWKLEFERRGSSNDRSYEEVKSAIYFGTQERLRYGRTAPPWREIESGLAKLWKEGPFSSDKRWEDVRDTICDAFSITDEAIKRLIEGESIQYDKWTQM